MIPEGSSYNGYIFLDRVYETQEVLPFISNRKKDKNNKLIEKDYSGNLVKMFSHRYQVFNQSCKCITCGRVGEIFRLQRNHTETRYHFGLWSKDNVQLTKDHIIPKSKGGDNNLSNYQTMCEICNRAKGSN